MIRRARPGAALAHRTALISVGVVAPAALFAGALAAGRPDVAGLCCATALCVSLAAVFSVLEAMVVAISLVLPFFGAGWVEFHGDTIGLFTIMLGVTAIVAVLTARGRVLTYTRSWQCLLFAAFLLVIAASLLFDPRTAFSEQLARTYLARAIVLPLVLIISFASIGWIASIRLAGHLRAVIVAVGAAGGILSLVQIAAAAGYFAPHDGKHDYIQQFIGIRAIGFSEGPIEWSTYVLLPLGLCLARYLARGGAIWGTALGSLLVAVVLSVTRSGWLATVSMIVLLLVLVRATYIRRAIVLALVIAAAACALLLPNFRVSLAGGGSPEVANVSSAGGTKPVGNVDRSVTLGGGRLGSDESTRFRLVISRAEIDLGLRRPALGVGLGNIGSAMAAAQFTFVHYGHLGLKRGQAIDKHNVYAGLFAELGIPGILVFLAIIGSTAAGLLQLRARTTGPARELAEGLLAALTGMAVIAAFTDADRLVFLWWIVGTAFGLTLALRRTSRVGGDRVEEPIA